MALKTLSTESMIALSDAWLDPKRGRRALAASPHVSGLLGKLEAAHRGLLATLRAKAGDAALEALEAIKAEQAEADALHDRKARGLHQVLGGLAEIADDAEHARALLDLRARLFPDGLTIVRASYLDEAGAAKLAAERVRKEDRALLRAYAAPGGERLDAALDAWLAAGARLGALDAKRASLGEVARENVPDRAAIARARNVWIRTVNALVAAIELDDEVSEDVENLVLARLREAEARVDRRGAGKREPEPSPEPGPGA